MTGHVKTGPAIILEQLSLFRAWVNQSQGFTCSHDIDNSQWVVVLPEANHPIRATHLATKEEQAARRRRQRWRGKLVLAPASAAATLLVAKSGL